MLVTIDPAKGAVTAPDQGLESARAARDGLRRAGRTDDPSAQGDHGVAGDRAADDRCPSACWSSDWRRLSHELRTPLNAILGNIELLLDGSAGPLAAPARACIGDIQAASRALLTQLQPLLLLVRARTSGPLGAGLPIDLLALVRQAAWAASDAGGGITSGQRPGRDAAREDRQKQHDGRRSCSAGSLSDGASSPADAAPLDGASLPAGLCLMVPGDPVWLGALAAAMVDLHAASAGGKAPLSVDLEHDGADAAVVLRAFWPDLDPAAVSPLPLALIDAVLSLHGGRIRSFGTDGLRLELPGASIVQSSMSVPGRHRPADRPT